MQCLFRYSTAGAIAVTNDKITVSVSFIYFISQSDDDSEEIDDSELKVEHSNDAIDGANNTYICETQSELNTGLLLALAVRIGIKLLVLLL